MFAQGWGKKELGDQVVREKLIWDCSSEAQRLLDEQIWINGQFLIFEFKFKPNLLVYVNAGLFDYRQPTEELLLSTRQTKGRENIGKRSTNQRLNDDVECG